LIADFSSVTFLSIAVCGSYSYRMWKNPPIITFNSISHLRCYKWRKVVCVASIPTQYHFDFTRGATNSSFRGRGGNFMKFHWMKSSCLIDCSLQTVKDKVLFATFLQMRAFQF